MTFRFLSLALAALTLLVPSAQGKPSRDAERIAQTYLIVDTHIDVPYRLQRKAADVGLATATGEFDHPRALKGGLNAPFMSIYTPARVDEEGGAFAFANESIDIVRNIVDSHPDKFALATCSADLLAHQGEGLISLPLGMENGGPIEGKMDNLRHFFEAGIRYITLAHSKSNHISDSSYDENEAWGGLSPFGQTLIGEMNRLGIMVDVSHLSDAAFWQVLALSKAPVIASHSSLRHYTPGFHRNMSDDMVRALGAAGGVIQINYGSSFIHQAARDWSNERTENVRRYMEENDLAQDSPEVAAYLDAYREDHPYPYADLSAVLDHIDRTVELAGIDAVGIGSDYDGVGDSLPVGLKDVSTYPDLIQGLLDRDYSEADIAKILGGNTLRVWRAVERYAEAQGTQTLCAAANRSVAVAPKDEADEFHFVVIGDAQFHSPAAFNRLIDQVRQLRPAFTIQVGDLIEGYNSDLDQIREEWQRFKRQIAPLAPIDYYPVPGNHDVYGGDKQPNAALEAVFEEELGPLYFAFEYKNALLVGLNSDSPGNLNRISQAQLEWFDRTLANATAEHRFVFMHKPPLLLENADEVHERFRAAGIDQVFYGHHHHYHHIKRDGIGYTMTNASGDMGHTEDAVGGFHHLLQISVRGPEVDVAVINADSIHAQDTVHPVDNYDTFALKRGLVPKSVPLVASSRADSEDARAFEFTVPLTNNSRREVTVRASCDSEDHRWQLEPTRIPVQTLKPGSDRSLDFTATYRLDRIPESNPQCTFLVPLQNQRGAWIELELTVNAEGQFD